MSFLSKNLDSTRDALAEALRKSGRPTDSTQLLAVSKKQPLDAIREASDAGQSLFGESRVQEAIEKIPQLPNHLQWHFIGHLQKNKVRKILPLVHTVHSVDSLATAETIDRIAAECGLFPQIYLQVNIAGDAAKFGFSTNALENDLDALLELPRLQIIGLMTIPPMVSDPEKSRPHFANLRELRDQIEQRWQVGLPGLSMGMSNDFTIAAEEGATIVRVGTGIFGARDT